MNYYIQGCAAKADKIKAAFEKLGYEKVNVIHIGDYANERLFFFTENGKVRSTLKDCGIVHIIKTHPDYKELELPVEPKFKVGDWIVCNRDSRTRGRITSVVHSEKDPSFCGYDHTGGYFTCVYEDNYHLWTLEDAKDGDVLATDNGWTCIFKAFDGCVFSSYCFMDSQKWFCEFGSEAHTLDSRVNGNIHPATKEQRDLLFKKMKEAGYQWDVDKKELRKIQLHYDIANFKPFDKVLVRQNDSNTWGISFFGFFSGIYMCCSNVWYEQCIPFNDDTKHLLGTADMCDEQYINW